MALQNMKNTIFVVYYNFSVSVRYGKSKGECILGAVFGVTHRDIALDAVTWLISLKVCVCVSVCVCVCVLLNQPSDLVPVSGTPTFT